ncbi:MAG: hypothetical protein HYV16_16945 [Gammaproteobacteria bacterium]|nr:hypothetical protein [Gammaproteobacteria bacterium]
MKLTALAFALPSLLFCATALAGTCEFETTRTACPGKEDISYKKCNGKPTCADFAEAADAKQCKELATAACENKRLNITKSKVITAKFDEQPITTDSGKTDFCEEYSKKDQEFNKC